MTPIIKSKVDDGGRESISRILSTTSSLLTRKSCNNHLFSISSSHKHELIFLQELDKIWMVLEDLCNYNRQKSHSHWYIGLQNGRYINMLFYGFVCISTARLKFVLEICSIVIKSQLSIFGTYRELPA